MLADDLGTSREVVSRILETFERSGMIRLTRKRIEIVDRIALDRLHRAQQGRSKAGPIEVTSASTGEPHACLNRPAGGQCADAAPLCNTSYRRRMRALLESQLAVSLATSPQNAEILWALTLCASVGSRIGRTSVTVDCGWRLRFRRIPLRDLGLGGVLLDCQWIRIGPARNAASGRTGDYLCKFIQELSVKSFIA
jgi:hypothetical protein